MAECYITAAVVVKGNDFRLKILIKTKPCTDLDPSPDIDIDPQGIERPVDQQFNAAAALFGTV